MLHIGCHLSSAGGFLSMGRQALELGADTFQFFTRNPRGSRAKALDPADAAALAALLAERRFAPIIAHAPYTLNLCSAEEKNRVFARETMADDLLRMEHLPGQLYNFHPGSHVGQGTEAGIARIAELLRQHGVHGVRHGAGYRRGGGVIQINHKTSSCPSGKINV